MTLCRTVYVVQDGELRTEEMCLGSELIEIPIPGGPLGQR